MGLLHELHDEGATIVVITHDMQICDPVRAGAPVLTVGSQSQVITAEVDVDAAGSWTVGSTVLARWQDGPDGTPAVRAVDDQTEHVVPVGIGIVADGWVEITSGLAGGELVRLPE
ncbi:MAG: hypothetical protein ACT4NY_30725 [Pseudonocardiales bacterium]